MLFSHFSRKGQSGWLHITFQKHGSFSWLVFQNLCISVLDMQTPLALNQLSKSLLKSLLSPISMVVTDSQPPLFGMLDSPKIMSFPFDMEYDLEISFFGGKYLWNPILVLYNHVKYIWSYYAFLIQKKH